MPSDDNIATLLVKNSVATAVACFFSPASAAAAGGVMNVVGANAIGCVLAPLTIIPPLLIAATTFCMSSVSMNGNYILSAILAIAVAAELVLYLLLAAHIGAAILGVAASPVFTCGLISAIVLVCGEVIAGAATRLCDSLSPRCSHDDSPLGDFR